MGKGGDNSAAIVKTRTRSSSARGASPRAYGPAGPARKSLTRRTSPRGLSLRNRSPPLDLALLRHEAELVRLRSIIIDGDRAHTTIVGECQQTFASMQSEYDQVAMRCKSLELVASQGQEIYGDGCRIDELDQYIIQEQKQTNDLCHS